MDLNARLAQINSFRKKAMSDEAFIHSANLHSKEIEKEVASKSSLPSPKRTPNNQSSQRKYSDIFKPLVSIS